MDILYCTFGFESALNSSVRPRIASGGARGTELKSVLVVIWEEIFDRRSRAFESTGDINRNKQFGTNKERLGRGTGTAGTGAAEFLYLRFRLGLIKLPT